MTQVVGTVYDGSTTSTTHTITVPSGVTTGMTGLFVIGTGSSTAVTTTLSFSGASFSKLDEQNAVNTRVAVWTGTNLAAGNTITLTLSGSAAATVGHYYQDDYSFTSGSLSAAVRSASSSSTTSGSVTPASGQRVVIVGVERTTTATTLAGVSTSGGDAVTNTFYGEGTGSAQASVYAGTYTAGSGSARTATISYSNSSGNGYAAQILTSGTGGGGGGGGGGGATTPGAMHNIGKGGGKNHYNLGIGYLSGHVDITENALEAGFTEPGFYELNSDGTAIRMSTPLDGGTTSSNTQYPRVEYRELQPGGAGDSSTPKAAWNGNSGVHYMKGRTRVLKMPPNKPQLVIAQTHDADDDTSMIRLSSKTNVEFKLGDTVVTSRPHVMGTWYDWMIRVDNGDISWYWGDLSTPVATRTDGHTGSGYYFKFGCYAQSNEGIDSVSDGPFIIEVAPFPETWHTGYAAPAIPAAAPTVNAGDDATVQAGTTFARTAVETSSSAITARTWKIQTGPVGVGSTIDTDASLAWTPTVAGFYTLRYSATNSSGTGTDDLGVTVTTDEPGGGTGGGATPDYEEKFLDGVAWPVITRQSTVVSVSGASAFGTAVSGASSGQRLTLASASYTGSYALTGKSNVTIEASTLGGATFGSGSQLTIKDCQNILIRGLNFTTDSAIEAINIRGTSKNIWIDQCTIGTSAAAVSSASSGQFIYISDTAELVRVSYNLLRNKGTAGNLVKVYGNDSAGQVNKHILVDHNILIGVKPAVSNGKESVRHGVSTMSKSMSFSTYCMNYWADDLSEPENFSGKAGGLLVYGNTFYRCSGGAVLRHGLDCVMSDNYFIDGNNTTASDGVKSGGIRGYDSGHDIEHNYMDGLAGAGFQASLLIDRGDAEGTNTNLNAHWRVINWKVNRNVIVNCATPIVVWNGSQYSLNPSNVTITNNITAGTTQAGPIVFNGGAALANSPAPSGNVHYASPADGGFTQDSDGIWRKAGYGPRLTYIKQSDVGPGGALYDTNRAGTALGGSTGGGTGTTAPVVNAGADVQLLFGSTLNRVATETGSGITARRWSVEAGPGVTSGGTAVTRPLIGWGGNDGVNVAGVTNELRGIFMARSSWTDLQLGNYIDAAPGYASFVTANPNAAALIGVPLIPHDSVSSTGWNALLDEAAAGSRDSVYTALGAKLATSGPKTVYARVWWEFNVSNESNINSTKFKAAWARAIPLIRSGFAGAADPGQTLKIVFCSMPDRTTKESHYPGSAYVDLVTYDVYGKTFGTTNQTKAFALAQIQGYLADLVAWGQSVGKPVGLDEWGNWQTKPADGTATNRGFGDWPEYITATFDWAVNPANNVHHLCYFNEPGGDVGITLNNTPNSKAVFVSRAQAVQSFIPTSMTLSTTAAVSWVPTQVGSYVLRYAATNSAGTGIDDITVTVGTGGGSATAPSFVGASTPASGESTAVDIPAPTGLQVGDFQLAVILSAGAETITAVPAGWSLMRQANVTSPTGDPGGPCTVWLYSATHTASAPAASWTKSGTRVWHAARVAYRGQSSIGATAVTAETSASTSHATPAVTPTSSTSRVVGVVAADYLNATVGPVTPPAGWTERYDQTVTSGTENETISIADVAPSAVSTTGTFTTALADEAGLFAVVLEGPQPEQVVVLSGIAPTGGLGSLPVSFVGPAQTVTLPSLSMPIKLGRFTVSVAAAPLTIQLRGIAPR